MQCVATLPGTVATRISISKPQTQPPSNLKPYETCALDPANQEPQALSPKLEAFQTLNPEPYALNPLGCPGEHLLRTVKCCRHLAGRNAALGGYEGLGFLFIRIIWRKSQGFEALRLELGLDYNEPLTKPHKDFRSLVVWNC